MVGSSVICLSLPHTLQLSENILDLRLFVPEKGTFGAGPTVQIVPVLAHISSKYQLWIHWTLLSGVSSNQTTYHSVTLLWKVVCAAPVQAAAAGGHDQDLRHAGRLLHLRLLPRVPYLRPPQGLQDLGLPRHDGPGTPLPAHQV